MANLSTENHIYICHFCSNEFSTRATLFYHFSQCQIKNPIKQLNEIIPQLTQIQLDILLMVKLRPLSKPYSLNNSSSHLTIDNINLEIPLSYLYSHNYLSSSNQSSFDDSCCNFDHSTKEDFQILDDEQQQQNSNNQLSSYHIYKYSRREHYLYYTRLKQNQIKQSLLLSVTTTTNKKSHINEKIFNQTNYLIYIPTQINSRQRISTNSNHIYPLLFSPNFHTLVKLPVHNLLENYSKNIRTYFHLLNSIASQEFQIIVHNYDEFSYTSLSFLNILRQTIYDYKKNLNSSYKRNYSHLENLDDDDDDNDNDNNNNNNEETNELSIPPLKIRRHDDSSYEIDKRSTSSSSSGMSITQIHEERRRCFDTRHKKFPSRISDIQINSNTNDTHDFINESPLQNDSSMINDYQQWKDRTSMKSSYQGEPKPIIQIREQSNDSLPKYQSVALNEGARIRIVNCSNDSNKNSLSTRNSLNSNATNKFTNSIDKLDENWSTKTKRINTRKTSSTNSKISNISEINSTYQTQSVILSNNEIAHSWLTHNVFYRCHACLHEEFFVVLSRECMRLHVSSKHGNMEENFKQRLSNFLNNQGRALKIFQHYLKWQQPWSEKEIDQIFQLSNINKQTNGAL